MRRKSLFALALLVTQLGCASLLATMTKYLVPPAETTSSLGDIVLTAGIESNLAPTELGTISQSFFPGWSTGGDMLVLMFSKRG